MTPRSVLRRAPVLLVLVAVASGSAACGGDGARATSAVAAPATTGTPGSAGGAAPAGVATIDLRSEIDHVHGLAVGAAGDVLAGTHSGVVRLGTDGSVEPVGRSRDDFMGMTGDPDTGRLWSSGHPGRGSDLPDPVGLLVSDDGGVTWRPVSLTGDVDFHALGASGDRVVGSGGPAGLLVSEDGGRSWREGPALAAAAIVVAGDEVWATTADGVQHSTDGGFSFRPVPDAPPLVLLSRAADGSMWGIDETGVAWRSPVGGGWESRAVVGAVEAMVAAGPDLAYAVRDGKLLELT
ncbi:MAG: F510_1955 family glycosylhydrolase [Kineosporiaceae bacterium]